MWHHVTTRHHRVVTHVVVSLRNSCSCLTLRLVSSSRIATDVIVAKRLDIDASRLTLSSCHDSHCCLATCAVISRLALHCLMSGIISCPHLDSDLLSLRVVSLRFDSLSLRFVWLCFDWLSLRLMSFHFDSRLASTCRFALTRNSLRVVSLRFDPRRLRFV